MPNCRAEAPFSYSYLPAATLASSPWDGTLHPNKCILRDLAREIPLKDQMCPAYLKAPHHRVTYGNRPATWSVVKEKTKKGNTMLCQEDYLKLDLILSLRFPIMKQYGCLLYQSQNICNKTTLKKIL